MQKKLNILINKNSDQPFTLLDWRQDFGGNMEYGDIYYDLAKLNHGFIISHKIIDEKLFYNIIYVLIFLTSTNLIYNFL